MIQIVSMPSIRLESTGGLPETRVGGQRRTDVPMGFVRKSRANHRETSSNSPEAREGIINGCEY